MKTTIRTEWSLDDLLNMRDSEPTHIVGDFVSKSGLTLIASQTKRNKTWLAYDIALAVVSGQAFLGMDTTQGPVLYFDLENSIRTVIAHRIKLLCTGRKINGGNMPFTVIKPELGLGLDTAGGMRVLEEAIEEYSPSLVVIDPLICTIGSADENKSGEMRSILGKLERIAEEYDM